MSGLASTAARQGITWALCITGMVLGSLAWSAWVFLNTWADASMTERVTEAVLADPEASDEVLAPVRDQVRSQIPVETGVTDAQIDAALDSVLADPAARERIADAFVDAAGSLRLDAARVAFGDEVARTQPALAPIVTATPPRLDLPDLSFAARARDLARASVIWLALGGIGAFGLSLIFGDPRRTARRFGVWAASMGLIWVGGPPLAARLARRTASSLDATVDVVVHEYARPVVPWATALVVVGLVAVVASFVPVPDRTRTLRPESASPEEPVRRAAPAPRTYGPAPQTYGPVASPAGRTGTPPTATRRVDATQEMPVGLRPPPPQGDRPATPLPADRVTEDAAPPPDEGDDEFDIWAAYESK